MTSTINWLDWSEETFKSQYPEVINKVLEEKNHMQYKTVNILVLCKQSKPTSKLDKLITEFKEDYKIMTSEVLVQWNEKLNIHTKNINESNIIKWCPMHSALPSNL